MVIVRLKKAWWIFVFCISVFSCIFCVFVFCYLSIISVLYIWVADVEIAVAADLQRHRWPIFSLSYHFSDAQGVFVKISQCICSCCKTYLSNIKNALSRCAVVLSFLWLTKSICKHLEIYLYILQNIWVKFNSDTGDPFLYFVFLVFENLKQFLSCWCSYPCCRWNCPEMHFYCKSLSF